MLHRKKANTLVRVVRVAADMFAARRFDKVSITDIAAASHCSTATIYEIYGTKENLFLDALAQHVSEWKPPQLKVLTGPGSLAHLLAYSAARIEYLSHPRSRGFLRALGEQMAVARPLAQCAVRHYCHFGTLMDQVQACMDAGLLRKTELEPLAYSILAGISFEANAAACMYGVDAPVDKHEILRKSFTPFVTAAGRRVMRAFLEASQSAPPGSEGSGTRTVRLPYTARDCGRAEQTTPAENLRVLLLNLGVPSPSKLHS